MNLRWLVLDFVPPELPVSREERRAVRRRVLALRYSSRYRNVKIRNLPRDKAARRRCILMTIIVILIASAAMIGSNQIYTRWVVTDFRPGWLLVHVIVVVFMQLSVLYIMYAALSRIMWRGAVIKALQERGYDVCRECGYFLKGLDATIIHCPECGEVREYTTEHRSEQQ